MSIIFKSAHQDETLVKRNIVNKGFSATSPTRGCTYVVQPPAPYQKMFQSLQKRIAESNLPIALVRIPHMTVITAKIPDLKSDLSWKEVSKVQKIYRGFFLYQINEKIKEGLDYKKAAKEVLLSHEETLAKIAATLSEADALIAITDPIARAKIETAHRETPEYNEIKEAALFSMNETSFDLKILSVELTHNGSVIFKLNEDEKMLQMRIDLIVAGQGISKWQKLSDMKHGWSTVGYTTKVIDAEEKDKTEAILEAWVEENLSDLGKVMVHCSTDFLGSLAVRSNDFHAVKRVVFPMATRERSHPNAISPPEDSCEEFDVSLRSPGRLSNNIDQLFDTPIPRWEISSEDLRMTPLAGEDGPTPIEGNREIQYYEEETWEDRINKEVCASASPKATIVV